MITTYCGAFVPMTLQTVNDMAQPVNNFFFDSKIKGLRQSLGWNQTTISLYGWGLFVP